MTHLRRACEGIPCPACGAKIGHMVYDTRATQQDRIRRARRCQCGTRFTTYEVSAADLDRIEALLNQAFANRLRMLASELDSGAGAVELRHPKNC